jgi:N-acyl-D-amino-acid deacylase
MNDYLIKNALVYDGSGDEPEKRDVGVLDGRLCAPGPARETIQASGLALMPGIIDNHTHYDAQITWDAVTPSPSQGVTTAILGNCGFTIAPCRPRDRELIMRNLTQVEGMSLDVLRQGIRWEFESFADYLALLERQGSVMNLAAFVGHSSVRTFVMGDEAPKRAATAEEVETMRGIVTSALKAGAIGFSSTTSPAHNGEGGVPMPSRLAEDDELRSLVGALRETPHGTFMLTKGGHTPIPFLEELASTSKRPVVIAALLHNSTNPQAVFKDLDAINAANERGNNLKGAVSCCPLTMDFTMRSPYPVEGLNAWKPALGKSGAALRECLASKEFRDALRAELAAPAVFRLFNGEWDKVHVTEVSLAANRRYEHSSVADIVNAEGGDPLDFMLDLALKEDLATVFTATLLNSDTEAVGKMLNHPHSLVSLSDAGAHLTFFNDAGFGLHLMGHWARDLSAMPLQTAIARLTSEPAKVFGIENRGLIKDGYAADLLLFDPQRVGRGPKRRVHDLPGGAPRLHTDPLGVHGVWINGVRVVDERGLIATAARPGQVLKSFARHG